MITKHTDHFIYNSSPSLSTVTNNNNVSIIKIANSSQLCNFVNNYSYKSIVLIYGMELMHILIVAD